MDNQAQNTDSQQLVFFSYIDKETGKVLAQDQASGQVGQPIEYQPDERLAALGKQGYVLAYNGFPEGARFAENGQMNQVFAILLKHDRELVQPSAVQDQSQLPDPASYSRSYTLTVRFIDDQGNELHPAVSQQVTWMCPFVVDKVTGVVVSRQSDSWAPTKEQYEPVQAPVIAGYLADQAALNDQPVAQQDVNSTITYHPLGRIVPVTVDGQAVPNVTPVQYQNDPDDAAKVVAQQLPQVAGYASNLQSMTPVNPMDLRNSLPDYITEDEDPENNNNVILSFKDTLAAKNPTKINFSIVWNNGNIYVMTGKNTSNVLESEPVTLPNDEIIQLIDGNNNNKASDLYVGSSTFKYQIIDLPVSGELAQKAPKTFSTYPDNFLFPFYRYARDWSADRLHYSNNPESDSYDFFIPTAQTLGNDFTYRLEMPMDSSILSYDNINNNDVLAKEIQKGLSQVAYKQGKGKYELTDNKNSVQLLKLTNGKYSTSYNCTYDHVPEKDIHVTVTDTTPTAANKAGAKTTYIAKKIQVHIDGVKNPVFGYQDIDNVHRHGIFSFLNFHFKHPGTGLPDGVTNYDNDNGDFSDKATSTFFKDNPFYLSITTPNEKLTDYQTQWQNTSNIVYGGSGSGMISATSINQPATSNIIIEDHTTHAKLAQLAVKGKVGETIDGLKTQVDKLIDGLKSQGYVPIKGQQISDTKLFTDVVTPDTIYYVEKGQNKPDQPTPSQPTQEKQTAQLSFWDDTANRAIPGTRPLSNQGVANDKINFSDQDSVIKQLTDNNYQFKQVTVGQNGSTVKLGDYGTYGSTGHQFVAHFVHKTVPATPRTRVVHETIHYVMLDGSPAPADPTIAPLTFTQTGTQDLVTGEIKWNDWSAGSKFNAVPAPAVDNHHVSQAVPSAVVDRYGNVQAIPVDHNSNDVLVTIYYAKDGTKSAENGQTIVGTQTIKFVDDQGNELYPSDRSQTVTFTKAPDLIDVQTGRVIKAGTWNKDSDQFGEISVPVISGYVTTKRVAGGLTATREQPNQTSSVVYHKIGRIIPVDTNNQPIPNAPTPSYINDPTDPTRVSPNEAIPTVNGYEPVYPGQVVTPVDATKDTDVPYQKPVTDPNKDTKPNDTKPGQGTESGQGSSVKTDDNGDIVIIINNQGGNNTSTSQGGSATGGNATNTNTSNGGAGGQSTSKGGNVTGGQNTSQGGTSTSQGGSSTSQSSGTLTPGDHGNSGQSGNQPTTPGDGALTKQLNDLIGLLQKYLNQPGDHGNSGQSGNQPTTPGDGTLTKQLNDLIGLLQKYLNQPSGNQGNTGNQPTTPGDHGNSGQSGNQPTTPGDSTLTKQLDDLIGLLQKYLNQPGDHGNSGQSSNQPTTPGDSTLTKQLDDLIGLLQKYLNQPGDHGNSGQSGNQPTTPGDHGNSGQSGNQPTTPGDGTLTKQLNDLIGLLQKYLNQPGDHGNSGQSGNQPTTPGDSALTKQFNDLIGLLQKYLNQPTTPGNSDLTKQFNDLIDLLQKYLSQSGGNQGNTGDRPTTPSDHGNSGQQADGDLTKAVNDLVAMLQHYLDQPGGNQGSTTKPNDNQDALVKQVNQLITILQHETGQGTNQGSTPNHGNSSQPSDHGSGSAADQQNSDMVKQLNTLITLLQHYADQQHGNDQQHGDLTKTLGEIEELLHQISQQGNNQGSSAKPGTDQEGNEIIKTLHSLIDQLQHDIQNGDSHQGNAGNHGTTNDHDGSQGDSQQGTGMTKQLSTLISLLQHYIDQQKGSTQPGTDFTKTLSELETLLHQMNQQGGSQSGNTSSNSGQQSEEITKTLHDLITMLQHDRDNHDSSTISQQNDKLGQKLDDLLDMLHNYLNHSQNTPGDNNHGNSSQDDHGGQNTPGDNNHGNGSQDDHGGQNTPGDNNHGNGSQDNHGGQDTPGDNNHGNGSQDNHGGQNTPGDNNHGNGSQDDHGGQNTPGDNNHGNSSQDDHGGQNTPGDNNHGDGSQDNHGSQSSQNNNGQNTKNNTSNLSATSKQVAQVIYLDADNGFKQLASSGDLTGEAGAKINYNTEATLDQLKQAGYQVVDDNFDNGPQYFDHNNDETQVFLITLKRSKATTDQTQSHNQQSGEKLNDQNVNGSDEFSDWQGANSISGNGATAETLSPSTDAPADTPYYIGNAVNGTSVGNSQPVMASASFNGNTAIGFTNKAANLPQTGNDNATTAMAFGLLGLAMTVGAGLGASKKRHD